MSTKDTVKEKQFRFLYRLYQLSEGDENQPVAVGKIREELGVRSALAKDIIDYLEGEGLIRYQIIGDVASITPSGADEIEDSLLNPDKATLHFPPMDLVYKSRKLDLDMQQASVTDLQMITVGSNKYRDLQELVNLIKEAQEKLGLDSQQKNNLQVELNTIEAQLISAKPKANLIPKSLDVIRRILEGGSGSSLESSILSKINSILN